MPEPGDEFERRLLGLLREWTDPAARPRPWDDEARSVIAEASIPARPSRFVLVTLATATTAAAVFVGAMVVMISNWRNVEVPHSPGTSANLSASLLVTPSVEPSTIPASELDLSQIAWWDLQGIGFGVVSSGSTPGPTVTVMPPHFRQVRIGTLDGRVTAMLAISAEWGHSYVSGPVNGEVLVVDDAGAWSTVRAVEARSGASTFLLRGDEIITAAALAPGDEGLYYAKADRSTGADLGVWFKQLTPEAVEQQVDEAPEGFSLIDDSVSVWHLAVSPDGSTLVAQFCFGEVRCTTHVIDIASGEIGETTAIAWPQGFANREMLGYRIGPGDHQLVSLNLDTLELRPVDDTWPGLTDRERPGTFGVELPDDWRADWPEISGDTMGHEVPPPAGVQLRHVTGDEVTTPAFAVVWPGGCEPIIPSEMPSGGGVGPYIRTLEDGMRWARFGNGDDLVVESMGAAPAPPPGDTSRPVTIRGHGGYLISTVPSGIPRNFYIPAMWVPTLTWEEGGCWYRVYLRGTFDEALEYAGRF